MQIKFQSEKKDGFYDTLRKRVDVYFEQTKSARRGLTLIQVKGLLILTAYIFCFTRIFTGEYVLVWYPLIGFLTIPLILNIGHEAVHNTFSTIPWLNSVLAHVFNLTGADGLIWRLRHVEAHHPYPNIPGYDHDISQSKLARITPTAEYLPAHRFQHWYMPFLYLVYTLNWLIYRDFKDFVQLFRGKPERGRHLAILIVSKIFYFYFALVLPLQIFPNRQGTIWLGFLLMQFVMSATTFLVLASAHVGENAVFTVPDPEGRINHTWAEHQLIATADFTPDSWLATHLFGGFNHHVAHHLFPNISHLHYPAITKIIKETASDFGIAYHYFPSLADSITSHFLLLKNNSISPRQFLEHADI